MSKQSYNIIIGFDYNIYFILSGSRDSCFPISVTTADVSHFKTMLCVYPLADATFSATTYKTRTYETYDK